MRKDCTISLAYGVALIIQPDESGSVVMQFKVNTLMHTWSSSIFDMTKSMQITRLGTPSRTYTNTIKANQQRPALQANI